MNGISALIQGARELPHPFYHVRTQGEASHLQPGEGASPEPDPSGTPILDCQAFKL